MIEIKLDESKYEELVRKGYSLDIVFLLKSNPDVAFTEPKILATKQTIERKGLITEKGLTVQGKELLDFISKEEIKKIVKKKKSIENDPFSLWWSNFPPTNTFNYKGKSFKGDRALRVKKSDCKAKLEKILNEGEYKIEELIEALKLEINQKAESSIKTNSNKLTFFQNSFTYLNQGTYEAYVELVRSGHKVKEEQTKSVQGGVSI